MPPIDKTPPFNPLIHGTNSSIFAMLPHTQLKITSTMKMLTEYYIAPLCGEVGDSLYGGGLGLHSDTYISFGRMNSNYDHYGLERVISSYSISDLNSGQRAIAKFYDKYQFTSTHGYEDINILLVYLARAKLLGVNLTLEEQAEVKKSIEQVIHYHYFLLLVVKYVRTNLSLLKEHIPQAIKTPVEARALYEENIQKLPEEIRDLMPSFNYEKYLEKSYENFIDEKFCEYFSYEKILKKITEQEINLKDIYENPRPENLKKILSLLNFSNTPFFIVSDTQANIQSGSPFSKKDLHRFHTEFNERTLPNFIYDFTQGKGAKNVALFEEVTLLRGKTLEDRLALMQKIIDSKAILFNEDQQKFIDKPFPIILISEAENKVKLVELEYRAQEDFTFGEEGISMIATDTPEHQQQVIDFLLENSIDDVEVVLFEQLKQSQIDGQRPISDGNSSSYCLRR